MSTLASIFPSEKGKNHPFNMWSKLLRLLCQGNSIRDAYEAKGILRSYLSHTRSFLK